MWEKKHLFLTIVHCQPRGLAPYPKMLVLGLVVIWQSFIKVNNSLYFWSITAGLLACFIVTNLIIDSVKFLDIYPRGVLPYNNLRETALK